MHYSLALTQSLRKLIKSLHSKPAREHNSLFVAEGEKLCTELRKSDYRPEVVVIRDSPAIDVLELIDYFSERGVPIYNAPKHQFDQICNTKTPQGILALVNKKDLSIDPSQHTLILDSVADPGNVGTIIRTAEWFGIKQILVGNESVDPYNSKCVRSTMGSIFRCQIVYQANLAEYLQAHFTNSYLVGAKLNSDTTIHKLKKTKTMGLVFGNESKGISEDVDKLLNGSFLIDGNGEAESLNVAVSVGISLFHLFG